jgi:hypothetical protein
MTERKKRRRKSAEAVAALRSRGRADQLSEFETQMAIARLIMEEDREVLAAPAKL